MLELLHDKDAVDMGFSLASFGAVAGLGTLFILFGSQEFLYIAQNVDSTSVWYLVQTSITVIFGWMVVAISIGGAAYEVRDQFNA